MATIRPTYRVEEVVLDLSDLKTRFVLTENQRKIRMTVVTAIVRQLDAGQHFQSAICVNKVTDAAIVKAYGMSAPGERLFDGGHRYIAMLRYLEANPSDKIKVTLHIYENLTPDQEKSEYQIVNKGTKQSTNDVVHQYRDDINAYKWMQVGWQDKGGVQKNFVVGVSIYPQPDTVQFYKLVQSYFAARDEKFQGGYMGDPFTFVEDAQMLKLDDVRVMNAFMQDFKDAFGPIKNNSFLRTTPFTALMRIWYDNRDSIPPPLMAQLFRTKIATNKQADELGKAGGFGATCVARDMFLVMLNTGRRKNLFVKKG